MNKKSLFYWDGSDNLYILANFPRPAYVRLTDGTHQNTMPNGIFSAYTVAELGEMLPKSIDYKVSHKEISGYDGRRSLTYHTGRTILDDKKWYIIYKDVHKANQYPIYSAAAKNEADCRAEMLIYLVENKLLNPNTK